MNLFPLACNYPQLASTVAGSTTGHARHSSNKVPLLIRKTNREGKASHGWVIGKAAAVESRCSSRNVFVRSRDLKEAENGGVRDCGASKGGPKIIHKAASATNITNERHAADVLLIQPESFCCCVFSPHFSVRFFLRLNCRLYRDMEGGCGWISSLSSLFTKKPQRSTCEHVHN